MDSVILTTASSTAVTPAFDYGTDAAVEMFLAQLPNLKDSSRRLYRRTLKQFFLWVARTGRTLADLTRADMVEYADGLTKGNVTGSALSTLTAASYITSVKLFYKWLTDTGIIRYNITAGIKAPKRENRFERQELTTSQAAQLTAETAQEASPRDNAIITLMLKTGLRTIEVSRANIGDMEYTQGQWILNVQGKGHTAKDNFVVLSGNCYAAIKAYLDTRADATPDAPLFVTAGNRHAIDADGNRTDRLSTRTISGIAKTYLKAIGLDSRSYTAHSLRHTFGCALLDETGDFNLVQLQLRHANPATTQIYTYHLNRKRRLEAAQKYNIDNLY